MNRIIFIFLFVLSFDAQAQKAKISGLVTEENTKSPVIEAKVYLLQNKGIVKKTLTDVSGIYEINEVPFGKYEIQVISLGYDTLEIEINVKSASIKQNIILGENRELDEIKVIGNIITGQNVPVAVTKISLQKITEELASRDLPMLLNGTAGVYATQQGGGDGDARINVRGFDKRNVGVMIDGVHVNDMENGAVYW